MSKRIAESHAILNEPHELPHGWSWVELSEICEAINGRAFKSSEWRKSGLPIIRIQNLKNPDAPFNYFEGELAEKHRVKSGDLLFAWSGTPGTSFGAHIWKGPDAALNQHIFNIRFDGAEVDTKYLQYALNQNVARYVAQAQGGVGLAHITKKRFMASKIPLGPLSEQLDLVAELDKQFSRLDEAVTNLLRVKANLKRYKAAVLKAAVEGRLVETEAKLARREGRTYETGEQLLQRILETRRSQWKGKSKYREPKVPDIASLQNLPCGWAWASLDQLAWDSCYGTSVRCDYEYDGPPVLRIPNIIGGMIDTSDLKFGPPDMEFPDLEALSPGDMLIVRTNGSKDLVGRAAIVHKPFTPQATFASYLIRFRLNLEKHLSSWILTYWNSPASRKWLVSRASTSAGQYNISMGILATAPIPLPPRREQGKVLDELGGWLALNMEAEKNVEIGQRRTEQLRQAILRETYSGSLIG